MTSLARVLLLRRHQARGQSHSNKSLRYWVDNDTRWTHWHGIRLDLNIGFTLIIISLYDRELLGFSTEDKMKWKTQQRATFSLTIVLPFRN